MTLNPSRSSVGGTLEDHLFRVRALEAERPQGVGGPVAVDLRNPSTGCWFQPTDRNFGFPVGYTLGYWKFKAGADAYVYGIARVPDNAQATAVLVDANGPSADTVALEVATYVLGEGDTWDGGIVAEPVQTVSVSNSMLTVRFPDVGDLSTVGEEGQLVVVRIGHLGSADGYAATFLSAGAWLEVSASES